MASPQAKVLVVDDDPAHLEIYGLLIRQAGLEPVPALVRFAGLEVPQNEPIGLVLLDYRLNSLKTSAELAKEIREAYPAAPIILLSDVWSLPEDMEPYAAEFVRKGHPSKLLEVLRRHLLRPEDRDSGGREDAEPSR